MTAIAHSAVFIRKRKFLMMLPVLISPFIILLFYILGGGKGGSNLSLTNLHSGLNLQLPDAHFSKKKDPDKMGLYEASNQDSDRWRTALKNDPYRLDSAKAGALAFDQKKDFQSLFEKTSAAFPNNNSFNKLNPSVTKLTPASNKEKEVIEKLNQLKLQLNKPSSPVTDYQKKYKNDGENTRDPYSDKVSNMLREMNRPGTPDPQIDQWSKLLDKALRLQNPGMALDSTRKMPEKAQTIYHMTTSSGDNTIAAVIPEQQTLVSGERIRIEIIDSFSIGNICIPANQIIYGEVSLSNERLKILVKSLQAGNNNLKVNLEAYDTDGLAGLYVPGSISRDVSKESFDQGVNSLALTSLDPSIGAQAASAGIQATKTLLSRKVKLVSVTIPGEHLFLLKDSN